MPLNSKPFVRNQHLKQYQKGTVLFSSPESHRKNIIPIIYFVIPHNEQIIDKLADEHSWNQISKFRTHEKKNRLSVFYQLIKTLKEIKCRGLLAYWAEKEQNKSSSIGFNVSVAQIKLNLFTHHIPSPQVVFN